MGMKPSKVGRLNLLTFEPAESPLGGSDESPVDLRGSGPSHEADVRLDKETHGRDLFVSGTNCDDSIYDNDPFGPKASGALQCRVENCEGCERCYNFFDDLGRRSPLLAMVKINKNLALLRRFEVAISNERRRQGEMLELLNDGGWPESDAELEIDQSRF